MRRSYPVGQSERGGNQTHWRVSGGAARGQGASNRAGTTRLSGGLRRCMGAGWGNAVRHRNTFGEARKGGPG